MSDRYKKITDITVNYDKGTLAISAVQGDASAKIELPYERLGAERLLSELRKLGDNAIAYIPFQIGEKHD